MKSKKRVIAFCVAIALVLVLYTGCSTEPTTQSADDTDGSSAVVADGNYKIGLSMISMVHPFYVTIQTTLQKICDEKEWELVLFDAQGDSSKQIANMEDLVTQGCDAILVNSFDTQILTTTINTITAGGTPVIAIDGGLEDAANVLTTVQADNYGNGFACGEWAAQQMGNEKITAVLISGAMGTMNSQLRRLGLIDGIVEEQLRSQGSVNLEIIFQGYTGWTEDEAVVVMEDCLSLNEDFNVLLSEADVMTMAAMKVLEEAGQLEGKLIAAAADGQKEAFEMIKQGNYGCTGLNSPALIAEYALKVCEEYFGGKTDFPEKYFTPAACVTIENVDEYYDPDSAF